LLDLLNSGSRSFRALSQTNLFHQLLGNLLIFAHGSRALGGV
jgi:hypothetical protein